MAEEAVTELMPVPNSIGARLRALKQEKGELIKEARDIGTRIAVEARGWTVEESALEEKISARVETLNSEIGRFERLIDVDRRAIVDAPADKSGSHGSIKSFGEFLQAVACASSPVIAHSIPGGNDLVQKLAAYNAASGMSVGTPSDGGYLVRKDWTTDCSDARARKRSSCRAARASRSAATSTASSIPTSTNRAGSTDRAGAASRCSATRKRRPSPRSSRRSARAKSASRKSPGLCYTTGRLLRDATALNGLLGDGFTSEFAFKIDNEIIRGTGSGQCLGILNSPALVTQAAEGGQTATTVNVDNVLKMYARMPARLKPGAVWLIHSDVMTQLPKMTIGQMPVWVPPGGLNNLPYGLLLGKPVIEIEQASALGVVGDILFVNLNEYVVITKAGEGLMADTSMHVRFLNNEMTFRWVYRINGQPAARTAITPANGSSTLSAFVALAAR
jgi:HK97 family phage major capsid protein